jgi:hypothetical protein
LAHAEDANIEEESSFAVFDDSTIHAMKEYFHVQERNVLLKYLRFNDVAIEQR